MLVTEQAGKADETSQAGPNPSDSRHETAVSMASSKAVDTHSETTAHPPKALAPGAAGSRSAAAIASQVGLCCSQMFFM